MDRRGGATPARRLRARLLIPSADSSSRGVRARCSVLGHQARPRSVLGHPARPRGELARTSAGQPRASERQKHRFRESRCRESSRNPLSVLSPQTRSPETRRARSGTRGSNPRPSAWEADALPTELVPRGVNELLPNPGAKGNPPTTQSCRRPHLRRRRIPVGPLPRLLPAFPAFLPSLPSVPPPAAPRAGDPGILPFPVPPSPPPSPQSPNLY